MSSKTGGNLKSAMRTVRPAWSGAVFVCGKCLKRHDDGKSLRQALKAEVKTRSGDSATKHGAKNYKVRIVKTACLGLCPRGAVILASATTLASGDVLLVTNVDGIADAASRLMPQPAAP